LFALTSTKKLAEQMLLYVLASQRSNYGNRY
jgi:hypothetical protein